MKNWNGFWLQIGVIVAVIIGTAGWAAASWRQTSVPVPVLPELKNWTLTEEAQSYYPETLFEYINGAAESYLSYEFKELIVAQYQKEGTESNLAVEIYDMGNTTNSFGIYSAERYPENQFIEVGLQGYAEEGALNFIAGGYYVKLLCFDCGSGAENFLALFAEAIVERIGSPGILPAPLTFLPSEGRQPNTEKFILQNFLGYGFLHHGYSASFSVADSEFDCFIIEARDRSAAEMMLERYFEAKGRENVKPESLGFLLKDRYYHNIFIAVNGAYICGVMKIKDGNEELGRKYLDLMIKSTDR